jgi:predicted phosphate transport protein (TIGR00153 family)
MSAGDRRRLTAGGALALVERALRGRDDAFFDLLDAAADNAAAAAVLLSTLLEGFPDSRALAEQIVELEHEGDRITHEIIRRLNEDFVTPIDREDILRLASALDDVVDLIDEVAAFLGLYGVEASMVQADALARVLVEATRHLALAVHKSKSFDDVSEQTVEVHRLENDGDAIVRQAIASLFEERIDPMVVIRWKDIFERLEDAIDATERAAFVLEGIIIKNV